MVRLLDSGPHLLRPLELDRARRAWSARADRYQWQSRDRHAARPADRERRSLGLTASNGVDPGATWNDVGIRGLVAGWNDDTTDSTATWSLRRRRSAMAKMWAVCSRRTSFSRRQPRASTYYFRKEFDLANPVGRRACFDRLHEAPTTAPSCTSTGRRGRPLQHEPRSDRRTTRPSLRGTSPPKSDWKHDSDHLRDASHFRRRTTSSRFRFTRRTPIELRHPPGSRADRLERLARRGQRLRACPTGLSVGERDLQSSARALVERRRPTRKLLPHRTPGLAGDVAWEVVEAENSRVAITSFVDTERRSPGIDL